MYSIKIPKVKTQAVSKNKLGLTEAEYQGGLSTLCGGCGHDSITAAIIQACFELSIPPHQLVKLSGIGCSSKTPGYFVQQAHGLNSVHGRMPSIATGANLAHQGLHYLGVSGDGDSGSIGFGQFAHIIRRRINMLYIVENNGVYGLTKGQFSATALKGAKTKKGLANDLEQIDLVRMAIQLQAGFVARSFSGDKSQLVPLIKSGLLYKGFAFIDVFSPCVSFNNHDDSAMSYHQIRKKNKHYNEIVDFVPPAEEISSPASTAQDDSYEVTLHHGSTLRLRRNLMHDLEDSAESLAQLDKCAKEGEIATGLLFFQKEMVDFHELNRTTNNPLRDIPLTRLSPGEKSLFELNKRFR